MREGPHIEALTRRLAECPREFLAEPRLRGGRGEGVHVDAVVADLLEDLGAAAPVPPESLGPWEGPRAQDRNLMRVTLVASWLCGDPYFVEAGRLAEPVRRFLATGLRPLSELVAADLFVSDPDRREELARLALSALELLPRGESAAQASDRLKSLGSVERARIIREMRKKEEAARKLKEQMAAEAARQAAARYGSE